MSFWGLITVFYQFCFFFLTVLQATIWRWYDVYVPCMCCTSQIIQKTHFYLSIKKVLIGDTIFTSPTGDGTAILRGHPSHTKVLPLAVQRAYLHFSVILRSLVLVRPRETNPRPPALRAVRRFTNWAGDNTELPHIVTLPKRGPFGTSYSEETPCSSILVNLNLL